MKRLVLICALAFVICSPAAAQSSSSYSLEEHSFNAGGHPSDEYNPASASYVISSGSIGQSFATRPLNSASFRIDGGFGALTIPPLEVLGLRFTDNTTLAWSHCLSAGSYNLYRDGLGVLAGLGYGACEQSDVLGNSTSDADEPKSGDGYFYLVTVRNRLGEEGTKGSDSSGTERGFSDTCP